MKKLSLSIALSLTLVCSYCQEQQQEKQTARHHEGFKDRKQAELDVVPVCTSG